MKRVKVIIYLLLPFILSLSLGLACNRSRSTSAITPTITPTQMRIRVTDTIKTDDSEYAEATSAPVASTDTATVVIPSPTIVTPTQIVPTATFQLINLDAVEKELVSQGFELIDLNATGEKLSLVVNTDDKDAIYEDEILHPVDQLIKAEMLTYLAIYTTFDKFSDIDEVTIQITINEIPALQITATRQEAYDFTPDQFSKPVNQIDISLLAPTAMTNRMANSYSSYDVLDENIKRAINEPASESLSTELSNWLSSADIANIQISGEVVNVKLSLDELAELFPSDDKSFYKEEGDLSAVDTFYSLYTRFPWIEKIVVRVLLQGALISGYQTTREQFEDVGAQEFNKAAAKGNPERVLKYVETVK